MEKLVEKRRERSWVSLIAEKPADSRTAGICDRVSGERGELPAPPLFLEGLLYKIIVSVSLFVHLV